MTPEHVVAQAGPIADRRVIMDGVTASIGNRQPFDEPYRRWILSDVFPKSTVADLVALPFPVADLGGVSGKRELHNSSRRYFDQDNIAARPICRAVSEAFQAPTVVAAIADAFGTDLDGTYLRVEYAQDGDGFWLEPHTDLGVKKFSMLYYLSDQPGQEDLGTDIYRDKETHYGRPPFHSNTAFVFIPSTNTWHGFEKRPIAGVRKSVIINYVTDEWRAREQLSWPEEPVRRSL